jgi:hypothetical protein
LNYRGSSKFKTFFWSLEFQINQVLLHIDFYIIVYFEPPPHYYYHYYYYVLFIIIIYLFKNEFNCQDYIRVEFWKGCDKNGHGTI